MIVDLPMICVVDKKSVNLEKRFKFVSLRVGGGGRRGGGGCECESSRRNLELLFGLRKI